eukprot:jgi/Bigna1/144240/aug1.85_g18948
MAAIASAERKKLTNDDFPEAVVNDKVQAPSFDEDDYAASSSCIATDDEDDNSKMASQRCLLFPIGANVEAVWVGDGNWYQAKVLQIWEPESPEFTVKYMVHYIGDTDDDGASKAEFDIVLVFYAQMTSSQVYDRLKEIAQKNRGFMTLIARKDFKWPNFRWWVFESGRVSRSHHDSTQLSEEGDGGSNTIRSSIKALKSKYEAIWVPDDDMRMSTTDINNLFHVVLRHPNILIASPSFTPTSEGTLTFFPWFPMMMMMMMMKMMVIKNAAILLIRYTNFVENSAALLRPVTLKAKMNGSLLLLPNQRIGAVISGCYLDFCFFAAVGYNDGDDDDEDDDDDNEEEDDDCVMVYHGIIISINEGTAASRQ